MWIDVWSTKHRLQIRASDIKVHNQWLDFNSSTSGPSFIARQSYRITQTVVRAVIKVAKLNVLFMAWRLVGSLKPVLQHMHYRISHILPGRTWPLTTDITCGRRACSYGRRPPRSYSVCRLLAAIQRTRRLAEVWWQVMAQAFKSPGRVGGSA